MDKAVAWGVLGLLLAGCMAERQGVQTETTTVPVSEAGKTNIPTDSGSPLRDSTCETFTWHQANLYPNMTGRLPPQGFRWTGRNQNWTSVLMPDETFQARWGNYTIYALTLPKAQSAPLAYAAASDRDVSAPVLEVGIFRQGQENLSIAAEAAASVFSAAGTDSLHAFSAAIERNKTSISDTPYTDVSQGRLPGPFRGAEILAVMRAENYTEQPLGAGIQAVSGAGWAMHVYMSYAGWSGPVNLYAGANGHVRFDTDQPLWPEEAMSQIRQRTQEWALPEPTFVDFACRA